DGVAVLADMLLVDRVRSTPGHRHLVRLPHGFADGVAVLANVLLVDRVVGAPADGHLVFLPDLLADGVAVLVNVLLVDRMADGVLANDVVLFPDGPADSVAALADVLFVNRFADGLLALFEDRAIDRPIAGDLLLLDDGLVTDAVTDDGRTALLRSAAFAGIGAGTAVGCPCRIHRRPQGDPGGQQ